VPNAAAFLRSIPLFSARSETFPNLVLAVNRGPDWRCPGAVADARGDRESELVRVFAIPELVTHFNSLTHRDMQGARAKQTGCATARPNPKRSAGSEWMSVLI
jgi:hypothetical protein